MKFMNGSDWFTCSLEPAVEPAHLLGVAVGFTNALLTR